MKKVLKTLGIGIGILLLLAVGIGLFLHESLPQGKQGLEAEALANTMLKALNYEAYQNTRYLEWSFRNNTHHYKWNKDTDEVEVVWDTNKVVLNLSNPAHSATYTDNQAVTGDKSNTLIDKALDKFNNDSFWLVAPYKVFDKGVSRSIVTLKNGAKGLLVSYTLGGSTPGDSYLWLLNENGFPNAYKMWVGISPIGGLEASWDDWIVTESGAFLPKSHKFGPFTLNLGNIRGY